MRAHTTDSTRLGNSSNGQSTPGWSIPKTRSWRPVVQYSAKLLVCSTSLLQQRHSACVLALSVLLALWQRRLLHFETP